MNTDVEEDVLMVLRGELADMMVQIALQIYRKYMIVDRKGAPILYVKLQKMLYGLMQASLLFYRKLRKELEDYGFKVNPYDPCVANKVTECGKQMTVIWHVNNLMGSCKNDFKLTKFSCYLAKIYSPKLSMHTGCKHNYLGVDMEFNDDGTLEASMITYLKNVISKFPEVITGKLATPAADHLFTIRDKKEVKRLDKKMGACIPSHGCSAIVHGHQGETRHPDGSGISDNQSKESRQRRLREVDTTEIPKQDKIFETTTVRGQPGVVEMVCRRVAQHALGL